jgi:DNA-binding phage protein
MKTSTHELDDLLAQLTGIARARGLNDSQLAAAAGLPKETLSRLRRRESCDFATLNALAKAVGARLAVLGDAPPGATPDGHFPRRLDRDYEAGLLTLAASGNLDPDTWRAKGPAFFMAGFAVMLAGVSGLERRGFLALAEALHPGSSHPEVFRAWLARSPLRPSRFLPMLRAELRRAA